MTRLTQEVTDEVIATILRSGNGFDAVATAQTADGILLVLHNLDNPSSAAAGAILDWKAAYYVATCLILLAMDHAPTDEALDEYRAELYERIMKGAL